MPRIVIENISGKTIDCPDKNERLLDILLAHGDWMHACGGKGRCTTCKADIVEGLNSLPPITSAEMKFVNLRQLKSNERLVCQVHVASDLVIRVPDENKLPHIDYSS